MFSELCTSTVQRGLAQALHAWLWPLHAGPLTPPPFSHTLHCLFSVAQRGFAQAYMPDYDLFKLVSLLYEVVPDILTQTGKVRVWVWVWMCVGGG